MGLTGEVWRVSDAVLAQMLEDTHPCGLNPPAEVELAAELGCSKSTAREALRHLHGVSVVQRRRGSGTMVQDFCREGTLALLPSYLIAGRLDQPAG